MKKFIFRSTAAIAVSSLLFFQVACTPSQIQTVIADAQSIVTFATGIINLIQGFGVLSTPQDQKDAQVALEYARDVSVAASKIVTEFNTKDSLDAKLNFAFVTIQPFDHMSPVMNQKMLGAMQLTEASVNLLIQQLKANGIVATVTPQGVMVVKVAKTPGVGFGFPGTVKHKLHVIKVKADANVKEATLLLAK